MERAADWLRASLYIYLNNNLAGWEPLSLNRKGMRQSERASIMRIVSDLIEADGIIDAREIIFLDSLREKYGIKKEDEVAAASYTFAAALNELLLADDSLKHDLIGDFNQTAMSDNYCAREEALLILALRCCMTINMGSSVTVLSIDTSEIKFEDTQILYVESEFDKKINEQIQNSYREICSEIRLAGFDFVYLPKIAEHYQRAHFKKGHILNPA